MLRKSNIKLLVFLTKSELVAVVSVMTTGRFSFSSNPRTYVYENGKKSLNQKRKVGTRFKKKHIHADNFLLCIIYQLERTISMTLLCKNLFGLIFRLLYSFLSILPSYAFLVPNFHYSTPKINFP